MKLVRLAIMMLLLPPLGFAEDVAYLGALGGIATLSADAGSQSVPNRLDLSSYSPSNGGAFDLFAGAHVYNYFSLQADFIANWNGLQLNSSSSSSGAFYQEKRSSTQQAGIVSLLVHFRRRNSRVRPYLAIGTGIAHLSSRHERLLAVGGTPSLPPAEFSWTGAVLRSHVGIDLRLARKLAFRYSFSETIGHNEISKNLAPPAPRGLKNFQNLFGIVIAF
jgi:hypothetical protein